VDLKPTREKRFHAKAQSRKEDGNIFQEDFSSWRLCVRQNLLIANVFVVKGFVITAGATALELYCRIARNRVYL